MFAPPLSLVNYQCSRENYVLPSPAALEISKFLQELCFPIPYSSGNTQVLKRIMIPPCRVTYSISGSRNTTGMFMIG